MVHYGDFLLNCPDGLGSFRMEGRVNVGPMQECQRVLCPALRSM